MAHSPDTTLDIRSTPADQMLWALHSRVEADLDIIDRLAPACIQPGERDGVVRTAVDFGQTRALQRLLLAHGYPPLDAEKTTLATACAAGHLDIARLLISEGVPARLNDDEALIEAAGSGSGDLVDYLLSCGCDPIAQGNAPILTALNRGFVAIADRLRRAGASIKGIEDAAVRQACMGMVESHVGCLQWLHPYVGIERLERIALPQFAWAGNVPAIQFLISLGCDPVANNCDAFSAAWSGMGLHEAAGRLRASEITGIMLRAAMNHRSLMMAHLESLDRRGFAADAFDLKMAAIASNYAFPDVESPQSAATE